MTKLEDRAVLLTPIVTTAVSFPVLFVFGILYPEILLLPLLAPILLIVGPVIIVCLCFAIEVTIGTIGFFILERMNQKNTLGYLTVGTITGFVMFLLFRGIEVVQKLAAGVDPGPVTLLATTPLVLCVIGSYIFCLFSKPEDQVI
jgi:hypothetical protein